MPFKKGDRYKCPDQHGGCEVEVKKGAPESCNGAEEASLLLWARDGKGVEGRGGRASSGSFARPHPGV